MPVEGSAGPGYHVFPPVTGCMIVDSGKDCLEECGFSLCVAPDNGKRFVLSDTKTGYRLIAAFQNDLLRRELFWAVKLDVNA